MRVIFSDRAYVSIMAETASKIESETGGLFLGLIEDDTWYVIDAIDPGPKSIFEVAYFEYDREYTEHLINKVANLYDHQLDLIGLWHRHPGSFDRFSPTDDETNSEYASMREEGAISGLVNIDPSFRLTMYHVGHPCRYVRIPYEVGDDLIPERYLAYCDLETLHDRIEGRTGASSRPSTGKSPRLSEFMRRVTPYLADAQNPDWQTATRDFGEGEVTIQDILSQVFIDDLMFFSDEVGIQLTVSLRKNHLVAFQAGDEVVIRLGFVLRDEGKCLVLDYDGHRYAYHSGMIEEATKMAWEAFVAGTGDQDEPPAERQEDIGTSVTSFVQSLFRTIRFDEKGRTS